MDSEKFEIALYFIFVRIDRGIANGASEASSRSWCSHLTRCSRVLTGKAKVQHVHPPAIVRKSTHGEIRLKLHTDIEFKMRVLQNSKQKNYGSNM